MKNFTEADLKEMMRGEAYQNSHHPEHQKTQDIISQGWENLYPPDDRNENPENYYVWYSRQDDKVRSAHARRHGKVFSWKNPPEDGHPGEGYNCRCLAIPYQPILSEEKRKASQEKTLADLQAQIDYQNAMISLFQNEIQNHEDEINKIKPYGAFLY